MLTVTRKAREAIVVRAGDEEIVIVVKQIRNNTVRIGIEAPDEMIISRTVRDCDQLDPPAHNVVDDYNRSRRRKGW